VTSSPRAKPKRRLLQFSIRTVLIVLTIFCITLGWTEQARKQRNAVAWIYQIGGAVEYAYEIENCPPPGLKWLRERLGVDYFDAVVLVFLQGTVSDMSPLVVLTSLEELYVVDAQVSEVTPLARLTKLRHLQLSGAQVRDVSPLARLTNLQHLDLNGPN
jgi:hypothetical protein